MSLPHAPHSQPETGLDRRWWSVREIAEDLCVSLNTVYKWSSRCRARGSPHSIRLANGEKRVRGDWYQEWLAGLELKC